MTNPRPAARNALVLAIAAVAATLVAAVAWTDGVDAQTYSTISRTPELNLAKVATARYRSVTQAKAAGYVAPPDTPASCVTSPAGGMGIHFEDPALMKGSGLNIRKPEILVYEKTANGKLRLVALEYFQSDGDQNVRTQGDRPTLYGRAFDGPMPGHHPGMGVHYDLHVWVWKTNPHGLFSPWNPNVRCPA